MSYVDGSRTVGGRNYRQHTGLKEQVRRKFNYTCQLCGGPGHDVDHIIPWYISHDSTLANLRVLCHKCNMSLRRKPIKLSHVLPWDEWCRWLYKELASCQS